MPDEPIASEATPTEDAPAAEPERAPEADAPREEPRTRAPSDWADLDTYCALLQAEHADWQERITALQTQLGHLRPSLTTVAAQYAALGIEDDLIQLSDAVLGGVGQVQRLRLEFDLERYVAVVWPVSADPRPPFMQRHGSGEYRVEIWCGIGPDGRGRIRVEGEKKLEAPLPTTRERLRRVLLSAIQAPKHVPPTGEEATMHADAEAPIEPRDKPEDGPVEEASPRPGDPNEQAPPEEQVIPLGPAGEKPDEQKDA